MKYRIYGGIYTDCTFVGIEEYEEYGPYDTYQEAYDVWKKLVWINIDIACHKLTIVETRG